MAQPKQRKKKDKGAPKKKGRHGWTTAAQEEFLTAHIPAYRSAQAGNTSSDFWPPLWEKYFDEWPVQQPKEPADSAEEGENADGETPPTLAEMKKVSILQILQNIFLSQVCLTLSESNIGSITIPERVKVTEGRF
jgi:hypothetical protein